MFLRQRKHRLQNASIRSIIFMYFTITALAASVFIGVSLYGRLSGQMSSALQEENHILINQLGRTMDSYLRLVMKLSDSLYYGVIKNADLSDGSINGEITLLYDNNKDNVENIALFSKEGELLESVPAARLKNNAQVADQDWFTAALEKTENLHFSMPHVQHIFDTGDSQYRWVVSVARAVEITDGPYTDQGVLLIDLRYNSLALLATWGMTLESFAIAMVLAVAVTVMRVSPLKPLRVFGDLYVQVFRNIPGIALLIIVVYALPPLKVVLPYRTCVIVATVLLGSAFGSENFMSGINTVGVGQVEAARSLGMSFSRILAKIVIPQALRSSVLPMTNLFIAVMLTTALGSQVPLKPQELTGVVSYINTRSLGGVAAFFISALGYLGTAFVVSHIGNYIDKKVRILR